jgi:hypothetical protein
MLPDDRTAFLTGTSIGEGGAPTAGLIGAERHGAARFGRRDDTQMADLDRPVAVANGRRGWLLQVGHPREQRGRPQEGTDPRHGPGPVPADDEVDVTYAVCVFQSAGRGMMPPKHGVNLITCSIVGMRRHTGCFAHHNITKNAGRLLPCALADNLGPHAIRVNNVAPGTIPTTMMNAGDGPVIREPQGESYLPIIPARRFVKTARPRRPVTIPSPNWRAMSRASPTSSMAATQGSDRC